MNKFLWVIVGAIVGCIIGASVGIVMGQNSGGAEVRVWRDASNHDKVYVSARPFGGSWKELGTIPVEFDQISGRYEYSDFYLPFHVDIVEHPEPEAEQGIYCATFFDYEQELKDAAKANFGEDKYVTTEMSCEDVPGSDGFNAAQVTRKPIYNEPARYDWNAELKQYDLTATQQCGWREITRWETGYEWYPVLRNSFECGPVEFYVDGELFQTQDWN